MGFGCDVAEDEEDSKYVECYDYAVVGVSSTAQSRLSTGGFSKNIVYSGSKAEQILGIVGDYPDVVYGYYSEKTYTELKSWLTSLDLPSSIAVFCKRSIAAYYYTGTDSKSYAVFAEDVSGYYKSAAPDANGLLKNAIMQQEASQ